MAVVNPANVRGEPQVEFLLLPTLTASVPEATPTPRATLPSHILIVTPTTVDSAASGAAALTSAPVVTVTAAGTIAPVVIISAPSVQAEPAAVASALSLPTATAVAALAAEASAPEQLVVPTSIPSVRIIPALGVRDTPTPAPTEVILIAEPTATATLPVYRTGPGRLWSTFTPREPAVNDHFWVGDPFQSQNSASAASPNYQFGSTANNRYRPHHGLDISSPSGTPIQAAVEGVVVHAGPDDVRLLGAYNNFYGNAVVIRLDQSLSVAGGELGVFVLYGHLSQVLVQEGQHVQPSDVVGLVGMTGIAIGPHLHVEVRIGDNTYAHNVNPYLWMKPDAGAGAVAVRLLTASGRTWAGERLSLVRYEGAQATWSRQIEIYLDVENIGPDPAWGENGAMGGAPAGSYSLIGTVNGEKIRQELVVRPGETTFVEIRTQQ